jgi:hypothetical protein
MYGMRFAIPFLRRVRRKRIPVLTYHALNAPGTDYGTNDHVALEEDLNVIRTLGFRVAPLTEIARYTYGRASSLLDEGDWVGLSFDDGTDYDYLDFEHPTIGYIRSMHTILKECGRANKPRWPQPTGVSFVIASPQARKVLDVTCIGGPDRWRDVWWAEAARGSIIGIGNHSWDHTHPSLDVVAQREQQKGTFFGIDNINDADAQIVQAQEYIDRLTGNAATRLFAYPYGHAPEYLVNEYFPNHKSRHRLIAAFGIGADYATFGSDRWNIPRFVCQLHWKSPDDLAKILKGAKSA